MSKKLLFFLIFISGFCVAQTTIKGRIVDEQNTPLENVTVIIETIKNTTILSYTATNSKGMYTLSTNKTDSLKIKVSYMGFKSQQKIISNKNAEVNFTLNESNEQLKEVIVKNKPIVQRGDTINYSVNSFKNQKDQVIADVLKKIPGIDVQLDGTILYQGKPIQKYYIEGLDLLEGKYNLANNNMPVNAVSRIQVLENHQPIKVLNDVVFSDRASLNIKLKKKNVLIGTAKMGTGVSPFLWDVNSTPMFFSKKKQTIISYQSNNTGYNAKRDIKALTFDEFMQLLKSNAKPIDWVQISPISRPPFSEKNWLDNSIHLISLNYLEKLKNEYQLKTNISYVNDFQKQIGTVNTDVFTLNDTITIDENKKNELKFNELKSKFILEKNTDKGYFKNTLDYNISWNSETGSVNSNQLNQAVNKPNSQINNSLKWIFPFKKNLITANSQVFYNTNSNTLGITPGQFESLLTNNNPYNQLTQKVAHHNFYTNNSFALIKSYKRFTLQQKLGFNYQNQQLNSGIYIDDSSDKIIDNTFINNTKFSEKNIYSSTSILFENNFFKAKIGLPFRYLTINRKEKNNLQNTKTTELIFEPNINLSKEINAFWNISTSLSREKSFGNLQELYTGYIVNNYRNIKAYTSQIPTNTKIKSKFNIAYKNLVNGVFIDGYFMNTHNTSNLIYQYDYDNNGAVSISSIKKENTRINNNYSLKISKYFANLNTTISLKGSLLISKKEQFLNNTFTEVKNKQKQLKATLDTDVISWLNINSNLTLATTNNFYSNNQLQEAKRLNLNTDATFFINDKQLLTLSFERYSNNLLTNQNNNFFNAIYRHNFSKKGMSFELKWNNILNTSLYENVFISNFSTIKTTYNIRPSQILASLKFRF
ncbi:carboxypeptidase-like regulatory domain-containing protein [Tenacibaculum insulae]|uniref:carboxypeptidase-like regulatory domain-containing protein n=1 Tax=Tenacibaculum insulae TaxID=2029677 RepID=UPI003AB7DAD7